MIDAILLAGAPNRGPLKDVSSAASEAMIEIAGRPMFSYVVDALRASPSIGRILVVGPPDVRRYAEQALREQRVESVESGERMIDNLFRGLQPLAGDRMVLIATSDIPLLTAEAVEDFLARCKELGAGRQVDLYYPIVSKEANEAQFPGVKRTYVRLRDGTFTGGNLALITPKVAAEGREVIEQAFAMRKRPIRLARLFGVKFIFKFIFRRLTVGELEEGAFRILGFRGAAVPCPYPEIGIDVDKPDDLQLVEQVMAQRGAVRG